MTREGRKAVVLLSGGLDSATVLGMAVHEGFKCHALSVDYGQRHAAELAAAGRVAEKIGAAKHIVMPLDLRMFGGSALTEDEIEVPNPESIEDIGDDIPATYVPARNTILLALALAFAESIDATDIFIGANAVDYSGYPDCRPEFIEAFQNMANLATRMGVEGRKITIHTPIMKMTKADIIRRGTELGVPFELTHSCYDPSPEGLACGQCDSCLLRRQGFIDAAVPDPTRYAF